MIDTNSLLRRHGFAFPEAFRKAADLARQGKTEEEILEIIGSDYDIPRKENYSWVPRKYARFGETGVDIPEEAIDQMETVMGIPPARRGALMPDAHLGYAMPIGGVVALENAVSPSFVGYDIACRMMMSVLDVDPEFVDDPDFKEYYLKVMKMVSRFGLGAHFEQPREHEVMNDPLWDVLPNLRDLKNKAQLQLGTSGGGNHFFDLMLGEVISPRPWLTYGHPSNQMMPKGELFVAIVTHSGSRGPGHQTATFYQKLAEQETRSLYSGIPKGYEWLSLDSEAGQEYWHAMQLMGRYAQANHDRIHHHFAKEAGVRAYLRFENHHNFAWKDEEGLIVHRKGATPAHRGEVGIIPGTSGTFSYLVEGLGNPDSLFSSSHGAGRPFSRTEAKRRHNEGDYRLRMEGQGILTSGVATDETYQAYKDIERVISVQQGVLVEVVARMLPRVVIMGGKADDGD